MAFPAACPRCDRMLEGANFVTREKSSDNTTTFIICRCGYIRKQP